MRLTDALLHQALIALSGWSLVAVEGGTALSRRFELETYPEVLALAQLIAFAAERANHHPQMQLDQHSLNILWWSHSAKGVTAIDLELARLTERLATSFRLAP